MYRILSTADLPRMTEICVRAMPNDFITESIMYEKTFGTRDFLPHLCLGHEDKEMGLTGFIHGTIFETITSKRGGIRLLAVDPNYQRRGIGSNLLRRVEANFQKLPEIKSIWVMGIPGNYLTPGVDPLYMNSTCFMEAHGYKHVKTTQNLKCVVDVVCNIDDSIKALQQQGYQFRRALISDKKNVLHFISTHFKVCLDEAMNAYKNNPITLHICLFNQEIVGFGIAEGNNVGMGSFGPFGVHEAHRKKGIATVFTKLCLEDLQYMGYKNCTLAWTTPVLNHFFSTLLKANRHRVFWFYEKIIEPSV
jgi:N-acetylglutamate synthase-like GNAT family acetyltransferase